MIILVDGEKLLHKLQQALKTQLLEWNILNLIKAIYEKLIAYIIMVKD